MNKFSVLCLGVLGLTANVLAEGAVEPTLTSEKVKPIVTKKPVRPRAANSKKVAAKKPTKSTVPTPSDIAEPVKKNKTTSSKMIQGSIPFKDRVSVGFYGFNGSEIDAANAITQVSYKVMPGLSVGIGTSLSSPGDFYYGLIDVHSNTPVAGLSPSFQIGYSGYDVDTGFSSYNDNGLLVGVGLAYPINHFADLDFLVRSIASKVDLGDNQTIVSLGVKINF